MDRKIVTGGLLSILLTAFLAIGPAFPRNGDSDIATWRADHHMHLASAHLCRLVGECLDSNNPPAVLASDAVEALNHAHVSKGVVLSCAYLYGLQSLHLGTREIAVGTREENEFTAKEVAKYPSRLVGFFSVDPLQDSALEEIRHWGKSRVLVGLKVHFTASGININDREHRRRVAQVIAAAAADGLPVVIHIGGGSFNATQAEFFIRDVLPHAGHSWIQIAHAGGGLPREGQNNLDVLRVFADHITRNDRATRHLLFDLSYVPDPDEGQASISAVLHEVRRIGIERFVFGSDFNVLTPEQEIRNLNKLGLSPEEWKTLQGHCAPWAC